MLEKYSKKRNQNLFKKTCRKIVATDPLDYSINPDVTVISMVGTDAIEMYLVAIKSFMRGFGSATIEAIDDGSLTPEDMHLLREHLPGIHISKASDTNTMGCPDYISWKRLFRIIDLSQNSYVIQLDSDTVTLGTLIEVFNKAKANEGFMVADGKWGELINLELLHEVASRWNARHPQAMAEKELVNLEFFNKDDKYLRGCAGFAGYPRGSLSIKKVCDLSSQIENKIGRDIWSQWGSEQTATNCLISKSNNPGALPWPKYKNYMFPPTNDPFDSSSFIHFIGTTRYIDDTYSKAVLRFLDINAH